MKYYQLSIIFLCLMSCSVLKSKRAGKQPTEVTFVQDVSVTDPSGQVQNYQAGSTISLEQGNLLIESPGHVSLLLAPVEKTDQKVKIDMKVLGEKKLNTVIGSSLNRELSQMLSSINQIQKLLIEERGQESLVMINELQTKYKELEYLDLLKVSALVVANQRSDAQTLLENCLKKYPDNKEAKDLYQSLFVRGSSTSQRSGQ